MEITKIKCPSFLHCQHPIGAVGGLCVLLSWKKRGFCCSVVVLIGGGCGGAGGLRGRAPPRPTTVGLASWRPVSLLSFLCTNSSSFFLSSAVISVFSIFFSETSCRSESVNIGLVVLEILYEALNQGNLRHGMFCSHQHWDSPGYFSRERNLGIIYLLFSIFCNLFSNIVNTFWWVLCYFFYCWT